MNPIIKSRLNKFNSNFGYKDSYPTAFEKYAINLFLNKYTKDDAKSIEDIHIHEADDDGIDGFAVIINGNILSDPTDINDLLNTSSTDNSVKVIFIQCKLSEKWEGNKIARFLQSIKAFTEVAGYEYTDIEIKNSLKLRSPLLQIVIENMDSFRTERIPCEIYYITTSQDPAPDTLEPQCHNALKEIERLSIYDPINFHTIGLDQINDRIRSTKGTEEKTFLFPKKVALQEYGGIEEAYIGTVTIKELAKLIINDNKSIKDDIFDDNVRQHQGHETEVNQLIYKSLNSETRSVFPYLNNGLTVVCHTLKTIGERCTVSGYQIINGCQTTYQIAKWYLEAIDNGHDKDSPLFDTVSVPIKLISTKTSPIIEDITVATNSQNQIVSSDIQATSKQAKLVEEHFNDSGEKGLRYARQRNLNITDVPQLRVVTTSDINRAFASVVLGDLPTVIRSAKTLDARDSKVWDSYPVNLYYFASWITFRTERYLISNSSRGRSLRQAKYHIAFLVGADLLPELAELYDGDSNKKTRDSVGRNLEQIMSKNDNWEDLIESTIAAVHRFTTDFFKDILTERAITRDDMRSKQLQNDLLSSWKENKSHFV